MGDLHSGAVEMSEVDLQEIQTMRGDPLHLRKANRQAYQKRYFETRIKLAPGEVFDALKSIAVRTHGEVAKIMQTSRQNVQRTERRGIMKLREGLRKRKLELDEQL